MTFEKVLQVFDDILKNDPMYEIVTTSHGYALLEWCAPQEEWSNIEHLPTPEVMLEKLLDMHKNFLIWRIMQEAGREELTLNEQISVEFTCQQLREKCESIGEKTSV